MLHVCQILSHLQPIGAAAAVFLDAPKTHINRENLPISANFPFSDVLYEENYFLKILRDNLGS